MIVLDQNNNASLKRALQNPGAVTASIPCRRSASVEVCLSLLKFVELKKIPPRLPNNLFTAILASVATLFLALPIQARLTPEQRAKLPPPATGAVDFKRDIQPIVEKSCVKCHGRGRNKGDFVFETRETLLKGGESGPAVIEGNSAESLRIELVSGLDPDNVMPAKGTKLTAHDVGLMRAWIDQGLKWDSSISFAKKDPVNLQPRKPELPKGAGNPVDRLLASYLKQNKVASPKPVDDRLFARRVYLDTIGLLPTVQELDKF